MTHQPNTAKTALVSTTNVWLPITAETPTGMKCLVIDKAQGIAYLREYWPGHGWTHYYSLPRWGESPEPTVGPREEALLQTMKTSSKD